MDNRETGLNYERMMTLKRLYEQKEEPEPGSAEADVYWAVRAAADYLCMVEREEYINCLWCPNRFISVQDDIRQYGSEIYNNCEEYCAEAYDETDTMCRDYIEVLMDFYRNE